MSMTSAMIARARLENSRRMAPTSRLARVAGRQWKSMKAKMGMAKWEEIRGWGMFVLGAFSLPRNGATVPGNADPLLVTNHTCQFLESSSPLHSHRTGLNLAAASKIY